MTELGEGGGMVEDVAGIVAGLIEAENNCLPHLWCTPYIRMIGMIVVFLGVVISNFVFLRGCSSEIYQKNKTSIC